MEERLAALARARGGLVTAEEAARLGVTTARLSRLHAAGALARLRRGTYAPAAVFEASSEAERYALRTRAVLRTRCGVAASHHAALAIAGVPVDGLPLDRIDVVDLRGRADRVRNRHGVVLHPGPVDGGPPRADAYGDLRLPACDALAALARDLTPVDFAVALDQALRCRLTSTGSVREALHRLGDARLGGRPGGRHRPRWVRSAVALLEDADPLSPCPAATRLRMSIKDLGFRPRLRVPISAADGSAVVRAELLIGTSVAVARTAYPAADRDRLRAAGVCVAIVPDGEVGRPERVAAAIAGAMHELESLRPARGA